MLAAGKVEKAVSSSGDGHMLPASTNSRSFGSRLGYKPLEDRCAGTAERETTLTV